MLPHGVLNHPLVRRDDEGRAGHEQEQPDRLQRLDCGVRKAPIEVIDEDYQAIYLGVLQEFSELLPEGMHLFRRIVLGDFAQKLVRTLYKRGDGIRQHILGDRKSTRMNSSHYCAPHMTTTA